MEKGRIATNAGPVAGPIFAPAAAESGADSVCLVIASPASPGAAIQPDGLLLRPRLRAPRNDKLGHCPGSFRIAFRGVRNRAVHSVRHPAAFRIAIRCGGTD